jgi:Rho GTPase-activating protein 32
VWPANVNASPTPTSTNTTPTKHSKPTTATISITYNLRSPITKDAPIDIFSNNTSSSTATTTSTTPNKDIEKATVDISKGGVYENVDINAEKQAKTEKPQKLLETTFDENIVYEQVKYFRNSICQVNDIIGDDDDDDSDDQIVAPPPTPAIFMSSIPKIHSVQPKKEKYLLEPTEKQQPQVVPDIILDIDNKSSDNQEQQQHATLEEDMSLSSAVTALVGSAHPGDDNDVQMLETDSLEFESQNLSLYENIELRHPPKVYENVDLSKKTHSICDTGKDGKKASLLPTKDTEMEEYKVETTEKIETQAVQAQNFSVRQLANKFETSPVEVPLAFDFNLSSKPVIVGSRKSESPKIPPGSIRVGKQFKDSNNSRSLDENAFIREFGGSKKFEHFNKSIAQIPEIEKNQVDSCSPNRRKSIEMPKMLNPPKKLPELKSTTGESEACKQQAIDKHKFELGKLLLWLN